MLSFILFVSLVVICFIAYRKREAYLYELEELSEEIEQSNKITLELQLKYEVNAKAEDLLIGTTNKIKDLKRKFQQDKAWLLSQLKEEKNKINTEISSLDKEYQKKLLEYNGLLTKIADAEAEDRIISSGLGAPNFSFQGSKEYKGYLRHVRNYQKISIKNNEAIICSSNWDGSYSYISIDEIKNAYMKITLRAFNSECDAVIANTTWRNVERMERRILKIAADIDKLNEDAKIFISDGYIMLKIQELRLTHEYLNKAGNKID